MLIQNYNKKSVIPQILLTFCCHACHAVTQGSAQKLLLLMLTIVTINASNCYY